MKRQKPPSPQTPYLKGVNTHESIAKIVGRHLKTVNAKSDISVQASGIVLGNPGSAVLYGDLRSKHPTARSDRQAVHKEMVGLFKKEGLPAGNKGKNILVEDVGGGRPGLPMGPRGGGIRISVGNPNLGYRERGAKKR